MQIFFRLSAVLFGLLRLSCAISMDQRFTVTNCNNDRMNDILLEAIYMVDNAIAQISTLEGAAKIELDKDTDRIASNLKHILGISFDYDQALTDQASKDRVKKFRENFQRIRGHIKDGLEMGTDSNYLYCEGDGSPIVYTTRTGPVYPNRPDIAYNQRKTTNNQPGIYYDPRFYNLAADGSRVSAKVRFLDIDRPNNSAQGRRICGSHTSLVAVAFPGLPVRKMLFCPRAFTEYRNNIRDIHYDQSLVGANDEVDSIKSQPGVFIHEMAHYIYERSNTNNYIDDQKFDVAGTSTTAYRFANVCAYSKVANADPVRNADSYRLFAEMGYVDTHVWTR